MAKLVRLRTKSQSERELVDAIRSNPKDQDAMLVYADYLEACGATARAEFLRVQLALSASTPPNNDGRALRSRLASIGATLDPAFRALVARVELERAVLEFEFDCPKRWESLESTDRDDVRFCDSCKEPVHYCTTIEEARQHAQKGRCVAVDAAVRRRPRDLQHAEPYSRIVGRVAPAAPRDERPALRLVLKSNASGSCEALRTALLGLSTSEVLVQIVHAAVGPITAGDINLAAALGATVIGLDTWTAPLVARLAAERFVKIRHHTVIDVVLDEVRAAIEERAAAE